mmetsp:Transcript_9444/g.23604  ORF Transcript_9444/g.23604 Transcript_9444/m.23604 type:complete len:241 (+) Transcript_9444:1644-2366(+)
MRALIGQRQRRRLADLYETVERPPRVGRSHMIQRQIQRIGQLCNGGRAATRRGSRAARPLGATLALHKVLDDQLGGRSSRGGHLTGMQLGGPAVELTVVRDADLVDLATQLAAQRVAPVALAVPVAEEPVLPPAVRIAGVRVQVAVVVDVDSELFARWRLTARRQGHLLAIGNTAVAVKQHCMSNLVEAVLGHHACRAELTQGKLSENDEVPLERDVTKKRECVEGGRVERDSECGCASR